MDQEIDEAYGSGHEDGYDEGYSDGAQSEYDRILSLIKVLQPDELIDPGDWVDGFETAKKLCLNIVESDE